MRNTLIIKTMTIYIIYGEDGYNNSVVDKAFKNYSDAIDYVVKNLLAHYKDEDDESEENICSRCNGFLYICEGGVGDVDCPSCKGTGLNSERVFDTENFVEFIENGVIFGEQPFLDLLHCEIVDTEQNGSACV